MNSNNRIQGQGQGNGQTQGGGRGQQGFGRQGQGRGQWEAGGRKQENPSFGQYRGVGPRGYTRSDERIKEDVSHLLSDHGGIDASQIEVQVKGGEVTLAGTVPDLRMKGLVLRVLSNAPGVQQLFDQVRVAREEPGESAQGTTARTGIGKEQRPSAS